MTLLGLFVDLRRLDDVEGHAGRSPAAHVARTLERIETAESIGCESVWFTEHHGFADGYLPQPLVLAAAVAARTSTVRLGTAVTLAPLRHPRHVAEQAALVDLVSGGRFELGLGAGYAPSEYQAFGVDMRARFDATDEVAREVARLLTLGNVTPGPVQSPLPIWMGYQGPLGARRAGALGAGLLSLDPRLLEPYRSGLVAGGFSPDDARTGGLVEIIVADDPERAAARLIPHWVHQQNTYRALRRRPDGTALPLIDADDAHSSLARTGRLGGLAVLDVDGAVAEVRRRLVDQPARHLYTWLSLSDMPDDLTERHIELWCGPVRKRVGQASAGIATHETEE